MDVYSPEYGNNRCEPSLTSILFWVPEGKKTKRWMIATPIKMKEIHPGTIANEGLPKSATAHQTEAQTQHFFQTILQIKLGLHGKLMIICRYTIQYNIV